MKLLAKLKELIFKPKAQLHTIKDASKNKAIVFVHGFTGNPFETWNNHAENVALYDLIDQDCQLAEYDLFTFGYRTGVVGTYYDFESIAALLCSEIKARLSAKDEIVIISHSQGGVVAQELAVSLVERSDPLISMVRGNVFLATPFQGSLWGNIAGAVNPQAAAIGKNSDKLKRLRERWVNNKMKDKFEQRLLYGAQDSVVSKASANPEYMGPDSECFMVDEGHIDICKINKESTVFLLIKQFLLKENSALIPRESCMVLGVMGVDKREFPERPHRILKWMDFVDLNITPRKLPTQEEWDEKIIPDIMRVERDWQKAWAPYNLPIRIYIKGLLSMGFIIGHRLSVTKGVKLELEHYGEMWKVGRRTNDFKVDVSNFKGNTTSSVSAVLVLSVSNNIKSRVEAHVETRMKYELSYRLLVHVTPANGVGNNIIENADQATTYAQDVKKCVDQLISQGIREIHLFMNLPLTLAVITGHHLTGICPTQIYEYDPVEGYISSYKIGILMSRGQVH